MQTAPQCAKRPLAVTVIASFQFALAAYCLLFEAAALSDPPANLGYLQSAMYLLLGRTGYVSYAGQTREEYVVILFFMSLIALGTAWFGVSTGWGLWRLKKWARHSVAGEYGVMAVLWARSFLFFGIGGGFSHTPARELHPVYWLAFIQAVVCLTLLFHGGVAEAFGEEE